MLTTSDMGKVKVKDKEFTLESNYEALVLAILELTNQIKRLADKPNG